MTGVKTQTYRSNCSQFRAKSGEWLPSRTIKTTFLKAVLNLGHSFQSDGVMTFVTTEGLTV